MLIKEVTVSEDGLRGKRFTIPCDRVAVFAGPNGAGKTTRLSALQAGLRDFKGHPPGAPTAGVAHIVVQGNAFSAHRVVGDEHSLVVLHGAKSVNAILKGQKLIDKALDGSALDVWDLGGFLTDNKSADKQRALILKVAGVTREFEPEAMRQRLEEAIDDVDDEVKKDLAGDIDAVFRGEYDRLTKWTDAAREILRKSKNSFDALEKRAKKTREQLPDLKAVKLPPGRIGEIRRRKDELHQRRGKYREQRAAMGLALSRRAEHADRLSAAYDELEAAERALRKTPAVADGDSLDEATARQRLGQAIEGSIEPRAEIAKLEAAANGIDERLEKIRSGQCPTCGLEGDLIATAERDLKAERASLEFDLDVACDERDEAKQAVELARRILENAERRTRIQAAQKRVEDARAKVDLLEHEAGRLPPEVDPTELDARIEETNEAITKAEADLSALERHAEAQRIDLENRSRHEHAMACKVAAQTLEKEVRKIESEVIEEACDIIAARVNEWVVPVLKHPWKAEFRFRQDPWGFGLSVVIAGERGGFIPFVACSDAQQATIMIGLQYAMRFDKPWKGLLVDGLERFDSKRLCALLDAADRLIQEDRLDGFLGGYRTSHGDNLQDILKALGGNPEWVIPIDGKS